MTRNNIQYFDKHKTVKKYAKCMEIIVISTVQDALDYKPH